MINVLRWFAAFFSALGAINEGLTYFFDVNMFLTLNNYIPVPGTEQFFYALVSLSGVFMIVSLFSFR